MILIWYDVKLYNTNSILTTQNVKFPIKDFFSKCDQNPQETADLVTFTEKIPCGKLDSGI